MFEEGVQSDGIGAAMVGWLVDFGFVATQGSLPELERVLALGGSNTLLVLGRGHRCIQLLEFNCQFDKSRGLLFPFLHLIGGTVYYLSLRIPARAIPRCGGSSLSCCLVSARQLTR